MKRWRVIDPGEMFVTLLPAFLIVIFWELFSRVLPNGAFLFGSPLGVVKAAGKDFQSSQIYFDIGITAVETCVGLVAGMLIGTAVGLSLWLSARLGRLFRPYIVILGAVPVIALAPIVIQIFGTGLLAKIALAAFSTSLVALSHAYEGARTAQSDWLEFANVLGASRAQILRKVIVPSALTWVAAGARLNVGFALLGAFIGEYISSNAGVGHYIARFGGIYDISRVFLGVALLAGIGLTLSGLISGATRLWLPVSGKPGEE